MKNIIITLIIISIPLMLQAAWENAGATEGEFLKFTSSARSSGLGGGYTALDDFNNLAINPSYTAFGKNFHMSLNTILFFQDVTYINLNSVYKLEHGGIGLGLTTLGSGDIPVNSIPGSTSINKRDFAVGISYGLQVGLFIPAEVLKELYVGINNQYFNESYNPVVSKSGDVISFGLSWVPPLKGWSIGVSLLNIKLFGAAGTSTPVIFKGGTKYDFTFKNFRMNKNADDFSLIFDFEKSKELSPTLMIGLESRIKDIISVRVGNKFLHDAAWFSAGLGVKMASIQFDYSISLYRDLGKSHQFSLSYNFDTKERIPK